jgi:hypothetical protein
MMARRGIARRGLEMLGKKGQRTWKGSEACSEIALINKLFG